MAGFFDFLNPDDPGKRQDLLAAAAAILQASGPSRTPVGLGQALGAGFGAYQQNQQARQDRELQQQQAVQQQTMRDLQIKSAQGELNDNTHKRSIQSQIEDAARGAMMTPEQQALAAGGGPTLANLERAKSLPGGFDTEGFINKVMGFAPLQALELKKSLAKAGPKYANDITWVNGPDGKPVGLRLADDGTKQTLDGFAPRDKLELANLGDRSVAYDPYGLQSGQVLRRGVDPSTVYSGNITMRGQNMADARAREANATSASNKAPTEFQGKSAAYGLRATEADKILNSLDGKYSPAAINSKASLSNIWGVGGVLGAGANSLMSDADQQAEQAQRDFVNAVLRQESGAAIGQAEFDNARKQYFRQPGDSKAVIDQKARNRQLAIQGLQANAGRAALTAPPAAGPAAPSGITFLGFE